MEYTPPVQSTEIAEMSVKAPAPRTLANKIERMHFMKVRLSYARAKRTLLAALSALLLVAAVFPPELTSAAYREQPAQPERIGVLLSVDGTLRRVMAYEGDTVDELLTARRIELGDRDEVVPARDTALYDGISVAVVRTEVETVTVDETVPMERELIPNEYMPRGTEVILSPGSEGLNQVTYRVVRRGGREIERTLLSTVTVTAAVPEQVEYGPGGTIITPDGQTIEWSHKIDGQATAYTTEGRRWKITRSGTTARVGAIAVDPKTIPLGSVVYVEGNGWVYGLCSCEDTGGAIKGNIIDLFFNTEHECWQFGRRNCTIYVISTPEKK